MVSVIIPTHNRCSLLIRAIESIEKQTFRDFEIIIVSDASTDETDEKMNELQKKTSYISYYAIDRSRGANYARNYGIQHAKGEYIAFLDDDDEWLPQKLEEQVKKFQASPDIGLVYCNVNIVDCTGKFICVNQQNTEGNVSKEILFGGFIHTTSCVMLKKQVAIDAGLFDESMPAMQDYDMWIRCCQIAEVGLIKTPLVNYYTYGQTGREQIGNRTKRYIDAFAILESKYTQLFAQLSMAENRYRKFIVYRAFTHRAYSNHEKNVLRKCAFKTLGYRYDMGVVKLLFISCLPGNLTYNLANYFQRVKKKWKNLF